MTTPSIPTGFKPVIQGYSIGAAPGVMRTEVAGGAPRYALEYDRGTQAFQVTLVLDAMAFSVWTAFYHHVIKKGAITFAMPIDSGFGLQEHDCNIVPGSYSAVRAGGQITAVSFVVDAEARVYTDFTVDDAEGLIDLWNEYGPGTDELLARLAQFATVDTLVLDF